MSFLSNKKFPVMSPSELAKLTPKETLDISKAIAANNNIKLENYDEVFVSPLSAGVAVGYPGVITDEEWAANAQIMMKKLGPTRFFIRMLSLLRSDLRGRPYKPLPLPNQGCPCKSSRKYSECCGQGVEDGDPEECKQGEHELTAWTKTGKDRLVRGCWNCTMIQEAPWFAEHEVGGVKIVLIGCRHCGISPTIEDGKKLLDESNARDTCAYCDLPIGFKSIHVEHRFLKGKHESLWVLTEGEWNPLVDFSSEMLANKELKIKNLAVHLECLEKAFPFANKVPVNVVSQHRHKQHLFHRERLKLDQQMEESQEIQEKQKG